MIFSKPDHIAQIKLSLKTQTRRPIPRYQVGQSYAIPPGRTKPRIPPSRIHTLEKWVEKRTGSCKPPLPRQMANAEGGYTPEEYEQLYSEMYPGWNQRYAYRFEYHPQRRLTSD